MKLPRTDSRELALRLRFPDAFRERVQVRQHKFRQVLQLKRFLGSWVFEAMQRVITVQSKTVRPFLECRSQFTFGGHPINSLFELKSVDVWRQIFESQFQSPSEQSAGAARAGTKDRTALFKVFFYQFREVRRYVECAFLWIDCLHDVVSRVVSQVSQVGHGVSTVATIANRRNYSFPTGGARKEHRPCVSFSRVQSGMSRRKPVVSRSAMRTVMREDGHV